MLKSAIVLWVFLSSALPVWADAGVGQWPSGGSVGVVSAEDPKIHLAREWVTVELGSEPVRGDGFTYDDYFYEVTGTFSLVNEGAAQKIILFLPLHQVDYHDPIVMPEDYEGGLTGMLAGTDAWMKVNGEKLTHLLYIVRGLHEGDDPGDGHLFRSGDGREFALWPLERIEDSDFVEISPGDPWWIWALTTAEFPPGESALEFHYLGRPGGSVMSVFSPVDYPLWSGAGWSDPIGTGLVEYKAVEGLTVDDLFGFSAPEGVEVEITGDGYVFRFENYEPDRYDSVSAAIVTKSVFKLPDKGLWSIPSLDSPLVAEVESPYLYRDLDPIRIEGDWIEFSARLEGEEVRGWAPLQLEPGNHYDLVQLCGDDVGGELEVIWHNPINFRTDPDHGAPQVSGCPTVQPRAYLYFIERRGDWLRVIYPVYSSETRYYLGWVRWRYRDPETGVENIYIR